MPKSERDDLCPCGSGRKFRKCHGAETRKSGVPAWLFFLLLGILAVGVLYYIASAGRSPTTTASPLSAPLPPLPVTPSPASPTGAPLALPSPAGRFENLPGFPLTGLNASQRQKFLDRVNSENCTCGCKGDTVARCVVQDPACTIAPAMATRILAEVQATQK